MAESRNIAPIKLELLFAVVHNAKAAYYSSLIQSHKANLQLSMPAKGSSSLLLNYIGITERPKSLILSVVQSGEADSLIAELDETFKKGKDYKGIAFTVPLSSVIGKLAYGFLANDRRTVKED